MTNNGKQLVLLIPYQDKSTRKKGEDCVANGKELFEKVKKSFGEKKEVKFGEYLINSMLIAFNNDLEPLKIQEESIVIMHAFGGEVNARLRDDNRGDLIAKDALNLLSNLIGKVKVTEVHFAICYSSLEGHIAQLWKEQNPELLVYGSKNEYDETSALYQETEEVFQVVTGTEIEIK